MPKCNSLILFSLHGMQRTSQVGELFAVRHIWVSTNMRKQGMKKRKKTKGNKKKLEHGNGK